MEVYPPGENPGLLEYDSVTFFLTPSWGSKRRAEQQAYEDRLDETMKRVQAEKER